MAGCHKDISDSTRDNDLNLGNGLSLSWISITLTGVSQGMEHLGVEDPWYSKGTRGWAKTTLKLCAFRGYQGQPDIKGQLILNISKKSFVISKCIFFVSEALWFSRSYTELVSHSD